MPASRPLATLAVALLLGGALATDAFAHGGNFRVPGGAPPGKGGRQEPPLVPVPPTALTPPPGPVPTSTRGRLPRRARWQPANWQAWWHLNLEAHLPTPDEDPLPGVVTPGPSVFRVGRAHVSPEAEPRWDERTEHGARHLALPYLLELLDPKRRARPSLVAAALLAVGRIARDRTPIGRIQAWAVDRRTTLEVRESAVLALGLLRRSEPARQLPAEDLGRLREFLLTLFDDVKNPMRVRAFAMFSLALLADQPYPDTESERDGRLVTRALWARLRRKHPSAELTISVLAALGHQPERGVPSAIREDLRSLARGRHVLGRSWDAMERSHALATLARLGGPSVTEVLLNTLRYPGQHDAIQAAALIGLAHRAASLASRERVQVVVNLRKLVNLDRHWIVRGLGYVTMGTFLGADLREGRHDVLSRTDVAAYLERQALRGGTQDRPYAALALGLCAYRVRPQSRQIAAALERVRRILAWGLERTRGPDETVGAWAVGVGLARAAGARPAILRIVEDKNRAASLRGHAALALAQLGRATPHIVDALLAATRERISPYVHLQAVRALGLLQAEGTTQELLRQLQGKRSSRPALAAVAGALGRLKDPQAASTLLDLARDEAASHYVRVAAVMALGLTFDPEPRPSRYLLTTQANYPALTWSLAQVFDIM